MSALNEAAKAGEEVVKAPLKAGKTVWGWIKSHPIVFVLMALVLAIVVLRYAPTIRGWIARIPWLGPKLMDVAEERPAGG